jgi:hypothetical protein
VEPIRAGRDDLAGRRNAEVKFWHSVMLGAVENLSGRNRLS